MAQTIINTLVFHQGKCCNCMACINVCPHAVFSGDRSGVWMDHPDNCMECGSSKLNCPTNAIEVQSGVGCAFAMFWSAIRGEDISANNSVSYCG